MAYAIKLFKTHRSAAKIKNELDILKLLKPGPNIIAIIDAVQAVHPTDQTLSNQALVLEFVPHTDFRTLFPRFTKQNIKFYMGELLKGLKFAHNNGVMHRDVRPHNVVIDHDQRKLRIVGWGSAAFYHPGEEYTFRIGTFKPPELLLSNMFYDYKIDMWGFGSILVSMVLRKEPFFHGNCIKDQVVRIAQVIGTEELYKYVSDAELELDKDTVDGVGDFPQKDLWTYVNEHNEHLVDEQVLDLLGGLLRWDPKVSDTPCHGYP